MHMYNSEFMLTVSQTNHHYLLISVIEFGYFENK